MSWRQRFLVSSCATAVVIFATQPALRWMVQSRLSQSLKVDVSIRDSSIRLVDNTIELRDMKLDGPFGKMRAERLSAVVNPNELLHRNLVLKSVTIDGVELELQSKESHFKLKPKSLSKASEIRDNSIDPKSFADHIVQAIDTLILTSEQKQKQSVHSIDSRFDVVYRRLKQMQIQDQNPLRVQEMVESIQKDLTILKQSIAEARLFARENDKLLRERIDLAVSDWQTQLANGIRSQSPTAHQIATVLLRDEANAILERYLSVVSNPIQWASAHIAMPEPSRGKDIALPGTPLNYTKLHSTVMRGFAQTPNSQHILENRYRFGCSIGEWSSSDAAPKPRKLQWHFVDLENGEQIEGYVLANIKTNADAMVSSQWHVSPSNAEMRKMTLKLDTIRDQWKCNLQTQLRLEAQSHERWPATSVCASVIDAVKSFADSNPIPLEADWLESGNQFAIGKGTQERITPIADKAIRAHEAKRMDSLVTQIKPAIDTQIQRIEEQKKAFVEAQFDQLKRWEEQFNSIKVELENVGDVRGRLADRTGLTIR